MSCDPTSDRYCPVRELAGADSIEGVYVGPDSCWLASETELRRLDPKTGETADVLAAH